MRTYFLEGKADTDTEVPADTAKESKVEDPSSVDLTCSPEEALLPGADKASSNT